MKKLHCGYIIVKNPKRYLSAVVELQLFSAIVKNDFSSTRTMNVYSVYYTDEQLNKILYWKKLIEHFVEFHLTQNVANIY